MLAKGVPARMRVAYLVGPSENRGVWDPFSVAVAGFLITDPLRSVPVCLFSEDEHWEEDVRRLASSAACIVIDTSADSASMRTEIGIVREVGPAGRVLWISDRARERPPLGGGFGATVGIRDRWVFYKTSLAAAIPRMIFSSTILIVALAFIANLILGGLVRVLGGEQAISWYLEREQILVWTSALGLSLVILRRYVWYPNICRSSVAEIRRQVRELCSGATRLREAALSPLRSLTLLDVFIVRQLAWASAAVLIILMWAGIVSTLFGWPSALRAYPLVLPLLAFWPGVELIRRTQMASRSDRGNGSWRFSIATSICIGALLPCLWAYPSWNVIKGREGPLLLVMIEQGVSYSMRGEPPAVWYEPRSYGIARLFNVSKEPVVLENPKVFLAQDGKESELHCPWDVEDAQKVVLTPEWGSEPVKFYPASGPFRLGLRDERRTVWSPEIVVTAEGERMAPLAPSIFY
jgi:hypothetical protein